MNYNLSIYSEEFPAKEAEEQAMHGRMGKIFGKFSEEMFFEGDQSALNPMRYIPTPYHTKMAQQRTALSQYIQQESVGTRMRRWDRPIHDFLAPYFRGLVERTTGEDIIPREVQHRRDLDTLNRLRPSPPVPSKRPLPDPLPTVRPAGPPTPRPACTSSLLRPGYVPLRISGHTGFFSFSLAGDM